jgi:methionyl-tRNA synthetase
LRTKFGSNNKNDKDLAKEDEMWLDIMEEVDKNKDGIISWKEFKSAMNNVLKVKLGKLH